MTSLDDTCVNQNVVALNSILKPGGRKFSPSRRVNAESFIKLLGEIEGTHTAMRSATSLATTPAI